VQFLLIFSKNLKIQPRTSSGFLNTPRKPICKHYIRKHDGSLNERQKGLDECLIYYNNDRTYQLMLRTHFLCDEKIIMNRYRDVI